MQVFLVWIENEENFWTVDFVASTYEKAEEYLNKEFPNLDANKYDIQLWDVDNYNG